MEQNLNHILFRLEKYVYDFCDIYSLYIDIDIQIHLKNDRLRELSIFLHSIFE